MAKPKSDLTREELLDRRRFEEKGNKPLTGRKFGGRTKPASVPEAVVSKAVNTSYNTHYVRRAMKPFIPVNKPFDWKLARLWRRVISMIWVGRLTRSLVWLRRVLFILQTHQMFGGKLAA